MTETLKGLGGIDGTTKPTTNIWLLGYYYQSGFDLVKTACFAEASCDWGNWTGYDGMIFTAVYFAASTTAKTSGYTAVCFPNPVSTTSPVSTKTLKVGAADENFTNWSQYLPLSCVGIALRAGRILSGMNK